MIVQRSSNSLLQGGMTWRASLIALCCVARSAAGQAAESPNVILIVVDDLNDWVEPLNGHPQAQTPSLLDLANSGVVFQNAHASAPVCAPSRISLLMGLRPTTTGYFDNVTYNHRETLETELSLFDHFRLKGYTVWGVGKLFHTMEIDREETWDAYHPRWPDPTPNSMPLNGLGGLPRELDWGQVDVTDTEMPDYKAASWAIDILGRVHYKPFFLAVGLTSVHGPWYLPRSWIEKFPPGEIELPVTLEDDLGDVPARARAIAEERVHEKIRESGKWRAAVAAYLGAISFVDAQIGRILAALRASDYSENTIVLLTADQGFHLGEKEHWRKLTLWEESTRVPVIVAGPGVATKGQVSEPVELVDVYPTLSDLAGIPAKNVEGRSFAQAARNTSNVSARKAITYLKQPEYSDGPHVAVRTKRWRLILYSDDQGEELYDHDTDPHEWVNVSATFPLVADSLRRIIRPTPPQPPATVVAWHYPNPARSSVTLSFAVIKPSSATLTISNLLGRQIGRLHLDAQAVGINSLSLSVTGWPPGVYVYRLQVGDFIESRKMVVAR